MLLWYFLLHRHCWPPEQERLISPFLGRLDDISMPGIDLIYDITEIFQMHNIETEIIAASVRNPIHVIDCAKAGADIATVPYKVLEQMTKHPLNRSGNCQVPG